MLKIGQDKTAKENNKQVNKVKAFSKVGKKRPSVLCHI